MTAAYLIHDTVKADALRSQVTYNPVRTCLQLKAYTGKLLQRRPPAQNRQSIQVQSSRQRRIEAVGKAAQAGPLIFKYGGEPPAPSASPIKHLVKHPRLLRDNP